MRMSRECFSPETEGRLDSRHSAPFANDVESLCVVRRADDRVWFGSIMLASNCLAILKRQQAESVVGVPTRSPRRARCSPDGVEAWFYLRLLAQGQGPLHLFAADPGESECCRGQAAGMAPSAARGACPSGSLWRPWRGTEPFSLDNKANKW
jgi:hypothetical protein